MDSPTEARELTSPTAPCVALEECSLFSGLAPEFLARIQPLVKEERFPREAIVFREGDPASELFILGAGKVELTYTLPSQPTVTLPITTVLPGDIFGWSALARNPTLTAQARTLADSTVYAISAAPLRDLLESEPRAGYEVMSRLATLVASRLRDTRGQLRWLQSWW